MTDASGDVPGSDPPPDPPLTRRDAAAGTRRSGDAPEHSADFQTHVRAARSEFESQVAQARAEFEEANERIKQRTGRDLIVATLIGLAIGAVADRLAHLPQVGLRAVRPGAPASWASSSSVAP